MSFRTDLLNVSVRSVSAVVRIVTLAIGSFAFATIVNATPVTVTNFSFESPDVTGGTLATDPPPGWVKLVADEVGVRDTSGGPTDGDQWLYMSSSSDIRQQPTTFANNTTYTLTVDVVGHQGLGTPGYSVAIVDSSDNILNSATGTANAWTSLASWTTVTVTYNTGPSSPLAGQALGIRLTKTSGVQLFVDNVHLDAVTVPEPTGLGLLGLGTIGLVRIAQRRSK